MTYKIWKPEHDGHAPPNWREGMNWRYAVSGLDYYSDPKWIVGITYLVPAEALNSPNNDAVKFVANVPSELSEFSDEQVVRFIQSWDDERKAKHGITLAPERDWARELLADVYDAEGRPQWAEDVRTTSCSAKAVQLLRTRFEQMIAERSKRDA